MAVDTRDKRASIIGMQMPWAPVPPLPDGAIGAADRLQLAGLYAGIPATSATHVNEDGGRLAVIGVLAGGRTAAIGVLAPGREVAVGNLAAGRNTNFTE
ncbi:MAG: hypothetical protein MI806_26015 [Minwuiales bacterium]|nr:hypothetical protein [Minwuiales bacterium]